MPLGIEDLRIPDCALSASSRWDGYHGPHRGRLNFQTRGRFRGAWSSRANNRHQWFQVDIGTIALLYGVATQGRQDYGQWVKAYKVIYSRDYVKWRWYQVRRKTLVSYFTPNAFRTRSWRNYLGDQRLGEKASNSRGDGEWEKRGKYWVHYTSLGNVHLPLPKSTFCPKWEEGVNVVLGKG